MLQASKLPPAVVFFGGDRAAAAATAVDRLQQPSVVAGLLAAKFPRGACIITVPPRFDAHDSACFDAWLPPGPLRQGVPLRYDAAGFPAAHSLHAALAGRQWLPAGRRSSIEPSEAVLVGFSKGAVVLHQILAELAAWQDAAGERCAVCAWQEQRQQQRAAAAPSSQQDDGTGGWQAALASVAAMHWVDGGADTRGAIYPSSPSLFAALARRCALHRLHLCLHGSPRQWADPRRPWLGAEARAMAASSSAAGAPLHAWRQLFWGEAPSLQQHFATLEAFQP